MFKKSPRYVSACFIASKLALFFGIRFERRKVDKKKANLHEN